MIRHIVLTKFRLDVSESEIDQIYGALADLVERLPGARDFVGGRSNSPEQIERGYLHGFVVDFDDWEALARYADHPEHQKLGARLVATAVDDDGILVVDLEA